jgi:hypothetical protein
MVFTSVDLRAEERQVNLTCPGRLDRKEKADTSVSANQETKDKPYNDPLSPYSVRPVALLKTQYTIFQIENQPLAISHVKCDK